MKLLMDAVDAKLRLARFEQEAAILTADAKAAVEEAVSSVTPGTYLVNSLAVTVDDWDGEGDPIKFFSFRKIIKPTLRNGA